MKLKAVLLASVLVLLGGMTMPGMAQQEETSPLPSLGMNITAPSYYDDMIYFNDVTRHGSHWISYEPENPAVWDDERTIPLTENGYPAVLQPDQAARQIIFLDSTIAPRGDYTLTWAGSGEIGVVVDFNDVTTFSSDDARRQTVTVDPDEEMVHLFIVIYETDADDPIRDVHLYLPGTDDSSPRFTSWFLERLAPFGVVRLMNWNNANYTDISTWEERPRMEWASWGSEKNGFIGVPLEVQVELANTLGIDMWVNVPDHVDDDYVRRMAELIRDQLNPALRVWVEYSNEAWNPIFPIFDQLLAEAEQVAEEEGLEDHYIYHQYGRRAGEIMRIVDGVFADQPERFIGVLAAQAGYAEPAQFILDEVRQQDTLQYFDVFAIAPYFGDTWETSVGSVNELVNTFYADETYTEDEYEAIFNVLDEGLDLLFSGEGEYGEAMFANREIAREAGLPIVSYEGGQHLVAGFFAGYLETKVPEGAYVDVNAHPRMYDIYLKYLDYWADYGGETMTLFHLGGFWSEVETFGHLRHAFQPLEEAHKYRALLDWQR